MLLVIAAGAGYYYGKHGGETKVSQKTQAKPMILALHEETAEKKKKKSVSFEEEEIGPIQKLIRDQEARRKAKELKAQKSRPKVSKGEAKTVTSLPLHTKAPVIPKGSKPRLVIIIDDVAGPGQLKKIRAVPIKLTPSIFPPSKRLRSTAKMAKDLKHYMIHFPMQAGNYPKGAMNNTLTVRDPEEKMRGRVRELRKWFPNCIYTNNHTGSVFTSDYHALHTVYGLLKEEGFIFIDSRTSAKTKGKKVANAYGDFYLHRDVFIDNIQNATAIRKQLKTAVRKAKKRGYAIAIGHPHSITLKTLKNSADILQAVDVVYIDELMNGK